MQAFDWNDLRFVLAVARHRSHASAARQLGVDPSTVGRRLRAVEADLGARLFERSADGMISPTPAGNLVAKHAESVESEIGGLRDAVQGADASPSGTVRITAVPILINRVLVPAAAGLMQRYPELRLELIAENRDLSLSRREADIAVRLARPGDDVSHRIRARRIGTLAYGAYAASDSRRDPATLPWLGYEEGMAHLPQARWISETAPLDGGMAAILMNDAEATMQAAIAGIGRCLLPRIVADRMPELSQVPVDKARLPEREIWLLTHPDLRHLGRIAMALDWIESSIGQWDRQPRRQHGG